MEVVAVAIGAAALLVLELDIPERVREWRRTDPREQAKEEYATGEISLEQYQRRIGRIEAQELCDELEDINGIGPKTSNAIVDRFGSRAALENADRDDLEEVIGVGPDTSAAIKERF